VRLPQTNATLTAVDAVGASEDYDRPASAGSAKWSGAEPVYLSERRDRVEQGETTSIVITRAVIVDADLNVDWQEGDTLTVDYGAETVVGAVRGIERHRIPTVTQNTIRLTLEDQ
jgi:hypothetical protein